MLLEAPRGQGGRDLFRAPFILLREPMSPRPLEDLEVPAGCSVSSEFAFELLARLSLSFEDA